MEDNDRPKKKKKTEQELLEGFVITASASEQEQESEEKIRWIGQYVYMPVPLGDMEKAHKVYKEFTKGGVVYKTGDYVFLNAGTARQPQIGKIKVLWSESKDKFAGIKLFFRIEDTVINRRTTSDRTGEIFHSCSTHLTQRHLRFILCKCNVKFVPQGDKQALEKIKQRLQNHPEKKLFFYSYWYDDVKGKLYDSPGTRVVKEFQPKQSFPSGGVVDLTLEDHVLH